jgi:hypothetical protein
MARRGRTWIVSGALALILGGRVDTAAAVTFDGVYLATVQIVSTELCELTSTQTGSDIILSGSGCFPLGTVSASGTIDSASGAFSVAGQADTPVCNTPGSLTIVGTVSPDSQSFSGTITCVLSGPISGVRLRSAHCGDGVVDPDEDCDPGFPIPGSCCSDSCTFVPDATFCFPANPDPCRAAYQCAAGACIPTGSAPAGARCNLDGNLCTDDRCDGAGSCTGPGPAVDCGPCSECAAPTGCSQPAPRQIGACLGPVQPSATLKITDKIDTATTAWSWGRGAAIQPGSFGDPTGGTSYEVCIFGIGELSWDPIVLLDAPAGGGWQSKRGGFRFRQDDAGGTTTIQVKPNAGAGRSRIKVKRTGPLAFPGILGITGPPFAAELRGSDGRCYAAGFDMVRLQTPERLRARDGRAR